MSDAPLTQLGRYRIVAELGRGNMGVVYKAEDPLLNRTVAIKTIAMMMEPEARAEYEARFYQEARAAGGLNHPNLITIHDIGREGDVAYMAMELLEGVELRELIGQGQPSLRFALEVAAQVADGLAYAHERGVVHRDIKPANVMIVRERHAKIMDFGIARMRVSDYQTQTGALLGSPRYMSPEQVTGQAADARSDIFSLGIVFYELLTGAPPFSAANVTQLMQQIASATPRPPSAVNPALPTMVDLIAAKALEKQADARYQSAAEFAADLRACLAELGDSAAAPPATGEHAARLDIDLFAATAAAADPEKTTPPERSDAAKASATTVPSVMASGTGTHLSLSRRFDSTEALTRLTTLSSPGGTSDNDPQTTTGQSSPGGQSVLVRVRQDPAWLAVTAAVIAALVIALVIAFH